MGRRVADRMRDLLAPNYRAYCRVSPCFSVEYVANEFYTLAAKHGFEVETFEPWPFEGDKYCLDIHFLTTRFHYGEMIEGVWDYAEAHVLELVSPKIRDFLMKYQLDDIVEVDGMEDLE